MSIYRMKKNTRIPTRKCCLIGEKKEETEKSRHGQTIQQPSFMNVFVLPLLNLLVKSN